MGKTEERVVKIRLDEEGEEFDLVAMVEGEELWLESQSLRKYGISVHDEHYYHTACCRTNIVHADAHEGKLYFRGYDMEELAEHSSFLEVAYLLIHGKLPGSKTLDSFKSSVMNHTYLHEDLLRQVHSFRYDAHPMGIMISTMASLSTFHPEANPSLEGVDIYVNSKELCAKQISRVLGKVTTIAACAYRVRVGRAFNPPSSKGSEVGYTENFLTMLDKMPGETVYSPHPELCKNLDRLFVTLADDGMNTATALLRHVCSSRGDPYTAISAAFGALYGARVSGVGDAVLNMLESIGSVENVTAFLTEAKREKRRIQGFGHLLYKAYDPRCRVVRKIALDVAQQMGTHRLLPVALELEKQVLDDLYFRSRRVFPNMDLYLSLVVSMMGFPSDFFSVLVSIPRTAGFLAHWHEIATSTRSRIARPRQIYLGVEERPYVTMGERVRNSTEPNLEYNEKDYDRRRSISVPSSR